MPYYLKGEAGKAMNATFREVGADLKIVSGQLVFENLGIDTLTWTARTFDLVAGETILPDVGQIVELYQGTLPTPTRYFRGWVTEAKATNYGTVVKVEGPAVWLKKMTVSDGNGRPTMYFGQQSVSTSITSLITQAIALGAPIALGSIASTYTIAEQQISMATFLDVLAELVRWVPDGVVWWDYSGTGTPSMNMWRRSGLTVGNFVTGDGSPLENYQATGRPDLVPSQVSIKYRTRASTGTRLYAEQADGSLVVGRVQTIGLSGEEMSDFLPADDIQYTQIQSIDANQTTNNLKPYILARLPEIIESRTYFGGQPTDTRVTMANGNTIEGTTSLGAKIYYSQPNLKFTNVLTGAEESRVGKYLLVSAPPPDWAAGALGNGPKVRVSGRIYILQETYLYKSLSKTDWMDAPAYPAWSIAFPWNQSWQMKGLQPSGTVSGYPWAEVFFNALDFEFESYLIPYSFPSLTTLWKPQTFTFRTPPSGLAANLRSAQNFTPYEGQMEIKWQDPQAPYNWLQAKMNITGGQSHLATMDAMVKRVTHDLAARTTRLELGAPARFTFGTLSSRMRGSSQRAIAI